MKESDRRALCYLTASISRKLQKARDPRDPAAGLRAEQNIVRKIGARTAKSEKETVRKILEEVKRIDPAKTRTIDQAIQRSHDHLVAHGRVVAPMGSEETLAGTDKFYRNVKKTWATDLDMPFTFSHADEVAINRITRWNHVSIGNHYDDKVTRQAARIIREVSLEQGGALSRTEIAKRMAQEMPRVVKQKGYFEVVASAAITHARGYSSTLFYSEARIDLYEVLAVDDSRTSQICREMNGKQFSVGRTLSNYATMDAATTADAAKDAWPWMREKVVDGKPVAVLKDGTPVGSLTSEELQARGYDAPPYHGRCRSTAVPVFS